MVFKYTAPKLTRYGKVTEFIEAGSIAVGDVTGDGVPDTLVDTDGDEIGDLIVGGANEGETPVNLSFTTPREANFYDGDGDGLAGIREREGVITRVSNSSPITETAEDDGWDDPARD